MNTHNVVSFNYDDLVIINNMGRPTLAKPRANNQGFNIQSLDDFGNSFTSDYTVIHFRVLWNVTTQGRPKEAHLQQAFANAYHQ